MTDQPDAPEDSPANASRPDAAARDALPPAVWVTGLILIVLLLLAVFGLG